MQAHMHDAMNGSLLGRKVCGNECPSGGRCLEEYGSIRVLKECAVTSFGAPVLAVPLDNLTDPVWSSLTSNHAAVNNWFELAHSLRRQTDSGWEVLYAVNGHRVCLEAWAAMHGVAKSTAYMIDKQLRTGVDVWSASVAREAESSRRQLQSTFTQAALVWWMEWLQFYEIHTKSLTIVYPRSVSFDTMYDDEFVPEMQAIDVPWKAREKGLQLCLLDGADTGLGAAETCADDSLGGSMTTWRRGLTLALQALAHEKIDRNSAPFKFESRKKHSAYKECQTCQDLRLEFEASIKLRMPKWAILEKKQAYSNHLQKMNEQRRRMDQIIQMCNHESIVVENSDKCGDSCLNVPRFYRAGSSNIGLYQYKIALQANVYAGALYFCISPFLHFNLLSFLCTLHCVLDMLCALHVRQAIQPAVPPAHLVHWR